MTNVIRSIIIFPIIVIVALLPVGMIMLHSAPAITSNHIIITAANELPARPVTPAMIHRPAPVVRHSAIKAVHHHVQRRVTQVRTYAVKAGDTLWTIAQNHHLSWAQLYHINKHVIGSNANLIKTGERLTL